MKCGEFPALAKHKITIKTRSEAVTDYGGATTTWPTLATVWAVIEPQNGREVFAQDQIQSRVMSKMVIRYRSDLKDTATSGKYKVSYDGRDFPIVYIKNLDEDMKSEGKVFQVLACEENNAEN